MSLPEAIIPLLVQFEPLFTQPTWRKALLPMHPAKPLHLPLARPLTSLLGFLVHGAAYLLC